VPPGLTALVAALFVIDKSAVVGATVVTVVVAVALLFPGTGSVVALVTLAVFVIVPLPKAGSTRTTREKVAVAPLTSVRRLQLTVPVAPTAGDVQLNAGPLPCTNDTNVVLAGTTSVSETLWASADPLFVTVIV
jgi:hypothetical protein